MPNHWESSARPLFVKTVFINGSRHAILSQKDPFLQSGNSSFKKQSRPNSSLSITSSFSLGGANEKEFISGKKRKFSESEYSRQRLSKDLSSDLQNCLINLRLVPAHQENEKSPKSDRVSSEMPEEKRSCEDLPETNFLKSVRRKGWARSKTAQNSGRHFRQETFAKNELSGFKKNSNDSYYFTNNLENRNKKNYPISPTFSQTSPNKKNWGDTYDLMHPYGINHAIENNPVCYSNVVSAEKVEGISENSSNDFYSCSNMDPCELYWNNYIMSKAINNSLTERVIQWLDLTHKKRKNPKGHLEKLIDNMSANSVDKIFAGTSFENDNPEKINSKTLKNQHKQTESKEKGYAAKKEKSGEEVTSEVKCEKNVPTILSDEKQEAEKIQSIKTTLTNLKKISHQNQSDKEKKIEQEFKSQITMITTKIDPEISKSVALEESILKTFVNVQELVFNASSFENLQRESYVEFHENKNCKKRQYFLPRQSKSLNSLEDEEKVKETSMKKCKNKLKNGSPGENEFCSESFGLKIENHSVDHSKSGTLKNGSQEILQKNITTSNNSNKTQNVLTQFSPKEHLQQDILWLKASKNAWQSVKDLKRPQLHIFMPLLFSKEPSEDCGSENDRCVTEL